MITLLILLVGFLVAGLALSALTLYINEFDKKMTTFCELARDRFRPSFHSEMEEKAARQIETLSKDSKR